MKTIIRITGIIGISIMALAMAGCGVPAGAPGYVAPVAAPVQEPEREVYIVQIWHSHTAQMCKDVEVDTRESLKNMYGEKYANETLAGMKFSIEDNSIRCEDYGLEDEIENPQPHDPNEAYRICMEAPTSVKFGDVACVYEVSTSHFSATEAEIVVAEIENISDNVVDTTLAISTTEIQ